MAISDKGSRPITVDAEAYRRSFKLNGGVAMLVVQSAGGAKSSE